MGLLDGIKRYKNRLSKHYGKEIGRKQLNFYCDWKIIAFLRAMAQQLEIPVYVLTEHCLELALAEVSELTKDEALKDWLSRHLVREHLLVPIVKPQAKHISRRLLRLKNAMDFLGYLEHLATPEQQRQVLARYYKELMQYKK